MLDRLAEIETKYEDLAEQINDPDVIANQTEWRKRMKEYSDITPIVEKYREYKQAKEGIAESLAMLEEKQEEDFRELLKEELAENKEKAERLKQELTLLLIPKDPNDEKNVIMEIRGGAGGDEAALFAGDLFRMYARYAERRKWKIEIMNTSESALFYRLRHRLCGLLRCRRLCRLFQRDHPGGLVHHRRCRFFQRHDAGGFIHHRFHRRCRLCSRDLCGGCSEHRTEQ